MERVTIPAQESGPDAPEIDTGTSTPPPLPQNKMSPQVKSIETGTQTSSSRPPWLPEKFKSTEEMAKAYLNLEQKIGSQEQSQQNQQEQNLNKEETNTQNNNVSSNDSQALAQWENNFSAFSQEYFQNGSLSNDSYSKLNEMGFPRQIVDAYINGQKAMLDQGTNALMADVGGKEGFKEMHDWAVDNLTQEEINSYNAILDYGDPQQAKFAVKGMFARYKSSTGKDPKLISGSQGSIGRGSSFRSIGEMTRAMADPRYKTDSAYRKDVEKRLANSNIL